MFTHTTSRLVIPDLHGNLALLRAAQQRAAELGGGVTQLGDLIDRGEHVRQVTQSVLSSDWTLCRGNHEDMLNEALKSPLSLVQWKIEQGSATAADHTDEELQELNASLLARQVTGTMITTDRASVMCTHGARPAGHAGHLDVLWGRPDTDPQPSWEEALQYFPPTPERPLRVSVHGHTVMPYPRAAQHDDGSWSLYLDLCSYGNAPRLAAFDTEDLTIHIYDGRWTTVRLHQLQCAPCS